jgi:predicted ArsR family transcriptional regulator
MKRLIFTPLDAAALAYVRARCGSQGEATISNRELAEHLGLAYNRQASRHWYRLTAMGLIEVVPRETHDSGFRPNLIRLVERAHGEVGDVYEVEGGAA